MANRINELIKEHLTLPFYPKVSGEPKIVIYILSFPGAVAEQSKELLYTQLPRYWSSQGLIDCKILLAMGSNTAVLIESWEKAEAAQNFRQSQAWQSFKSQLRKLGTQMELIVNDSFELIE